jgi:hypothetical protein
LTPAWLSDSPRADHVTFVVEQPLESIARLISHPAYDPAFFVNVLILSRQITYVANQLFTHYLVVLVQGGLYDVPQLIHRALHCPAISVGAFGSSAGLTSTFFWVSAVLIASVARTSGHLPRTLSSRLGSLSSTFAYFSRGLPGAFTNLLCGLTGALADIFHRRLGT